MGGAGRWLLLLSGTQLGGAVSLHSLCQILFSQARLDSKYYNLWAAYPVQAGGQAIADVIFALGNPGFCKF
jgi:hypothetical protein